MTYFEYLAYINEAKNCADFDSFVGDMGFDAGVPYSGDNWNRVCEIIFAAAHNNVKSIIGTMTSRAFALKYELPDRTVQRWVQGERTAHSFVTVLLGYAVIGDIEQLAEIT